MAILSAGHSSTTLPVPLVPIPSYESGVLLDVALETTASTGSPLLAPDGEQLRVPQPTDSAAIDQLSFMTGDVLSSEASRFLQGAARPGPWRPFALKDLAEVLAVVVPG